MAHIFLSYVREDSALVDRLARDLALGGVAIWLDRKSISPGQHWDIAIRDAVRSGDFFIACFSETSVNKIRSGMNQELVLAIDELMLRPLNRAWFLPVLLSPCEVPEYGLGGTTTLRSIQYVSLYKDWNEGIQKIIDVVAPNRTKIDTALQRRNDVKVKLLNSVDENGFYELFTALEHFADHPTSLIPEPVPLGRQISFSPSTMKALAGISKLDAILFLEDCFARNKSTLLGADILQVIAKIGDSASLPLVLEGFLDWQLSPHHVEYTLFTEGGALSSSFPFRELHAVAYFGQAAIPGLKKNLQSNSVLRRIRACAALSILDKDGSEKYEVILAAAVKEGERASVEGLFALRCSTISLQTDAYSSSVKLEHLKLL